MPEEATMSIKRRLCALIVALGLLGGIPATALAAGSSYWNVAGTYGVSVEYLGVSYQETLVLTQAGTGTITGVSLGAPCSPLCANFVITSGTVVGDAITIVATSPFTVTLAGTLAADGTMTGTWADGPGGSNRTGTWATTSGAAAFLTAPSHQKIDVLTQIAPGNNGAAVGAVIFNTSAGDPNNLELTLQLKKVTPDTSYDVYLFLDTWASGQGIVVGTFTTNGVGNGTFHVNTYVSPGIHSVAIDVTLHGSGADLYVTEGLYGLNQFLYFK
jgi:hypothetical protein